MQPDTQRPRVGLVGGGQLGLMLAEAARPLGIDLRALVTPDEAPVLPPEVEVVVASLDDVDALSRFAASVDVITFEHEWVPLEVLRALEARGHVVRPGSAAMAFSDKAHQRRSFAAAGLAVPAFTVTESVDDVVAFAADHGWPVVVKTAQLGYDGRGVCVAADVDEVRAFMHGPRRQFIVEEMLDLATEVAVVVARRPGGESVVYPLVETVQLAGMCDHVLLPAGVSPEVARDALALGAAVAAVVGAVGILAVELFVTRDGRVLVNEIAPRVHNSGHLTIEACRTSQFENHLRGVLDLPLGDPSPVGRAAAMVNVIGHGDTDPRAATPTTDADVHVHLYGKAPRQGRKLGHVTALADATDTALARARGAESQLHQRRTADPDDHAIAGAPS
jgi:5-(carboxyamino)imidazole ribonucleotide synthase